MLQKFEALLAKTLGKYLNCGPIKSYLTVVQNRPRYKSYLKYVKNRGGGGFPTTFGKCPSFSLWVYSLIFPGVPPHSFYIVFKCLSV